MASSTVAAGAGSLALEQTTYDENGLRVLSGLTTFVVRHPGTGEPYETRKLKYTTPRGFADRSPGSVNLWFVFHGGGGSTDSMNRYFEHVPAGSPTVLVFPEALPLAIDGSTRWRNVAFPGEETDPGSFGDVVFVEQLLAALLADNPQLSADHVYASGFSSGGSMTWMLLCYRSSLFAGFGMYSKQLGVGRRDGGCGDGRGLDANGRRTVVTGYETLTGRVPDFYGDNPDAGVSAPVRPVFYEHGTADNNLVYTGPPGCSTAPDPCPPDRDPAFSMAGAGSPLEDRDDVLTKDWLVGRHALREKPKDIVIPDEDPLHGDDVVVTVEHHYDKPAVPADVARASVPGNSREPVRWLEMHGHGHAVSALDHHADVCDNTAGPGQTPCNINPNASKDFDTSLVNLAFFEQHARMRR